jgi:hypothetical protein
VKKSRRVWGLRATDPTPGNKEWDFKMVSYTESGVPSIAGDLVFAGGMKGNSVALNGRIRVGQH